MKEQKQYVYWATKKGDPDWMEDLIIESNEKLNMEELKTILDKKGYDRVRESIVDLREEPDFINTIKI